MVALQTAVGDRYVVEEMRKMVTTSVENNQGHIVFLDLNTTGDGFSLSGNSINECYETNR